MRAFRRVWLSISLIAIGLGIALLVVASAVGVRWNNVPTSSLNEKYEGIKNINMDISYGTVKIINGDEFSVSADHIPSDYYKSYVTDGTWHMKEDYESYINIFGFQFPYTEMFNWGGHDTPEIEITIPKGFTFDNFKLNVGAGDVEADTINTLNGEFSVGAGKLQVRNLSVKNKSYYKVGTGEMTLENSSLNSVFVDCGVGNTEINGIITGKSRIKCGIGYVGMNLDKDKQDYSYEISSGIGSIDIDGENYHNISNKIINNNNSDNSLNLDCGIGKIYVDFN